MDARRIGLTALRGAALTLSIGIVAALMVRANAGCSDKSDIGADPAHAGATTATATASEGPTEGYMPASKSMGGEGRRLLSPSVDAAASAPAATNSPTFFPSTKDGGPMPPAASGPRFFPGSKVGEPMPPAPQQANPPPTQQKAP